MSTDEITVRLEIEEIQKRIQNLRDIAIEPFAIKVAEGLSVEIQPRDTDERISILKDNHGFTVVNYTSEGVVVDVFNNNDLEPICSHWMDNADLTLDDEDDGEQERTTEAG